MEQSTLDLLTQRAKDSVTKALEKHPTFPIEVFQSGSSQIFKMDLDAVRKKNDTAEKNGSQTIIEVLLEEVLEFAFALESKDRDASFEEAGDVVAVVLRALETITA